MPSNDSRSRNRGLWTHWVPLAVTVGVATVGVAAWAWSQRSDEDDESEAEHEEQHHLDYNNADYGDNPPYGAANARGGDPRNQQQPPNSSFSRERGTSYGVTDPPPEATGLAAGWGNQMSGALRRTPSPQQFLSNAGKTVAAGVAGMGAAMGSALASIREDDKASYADHETWSREADSQREKPRSKGSRRKTVAIVVSADSNLDDIDSDGFHEHASILSHIPRSIDYTKVNLFVLIYSPRVDESTFGVPASNPPPPSMSSSFSMVNHEQAHTPSSEKKSPLLGSTPGNAAVNAVYSQAMELVERSTMVMPFSTANGFVHMLRQLPSQPEILYLQESLSGKDGSHVAQLQSWLRHDVILVVGAEGGHGGLADSESEVERPGRKSNKARDELWWHRPDRVGRGRGVVVVDSLRLGDDWARRVQEKE